MVKKVLFLIGYIWISVSVYSQSNSCNCYVTNADTIYQSVPMTQGTDIGYPPEYHCKNCSSQPIKLPFNFCFYGQEYDTVYINNKGNLTFIHPEFDFSSNGFPLGNDTLMLAPFYSDVDDTPQNPSSISYAGIYYSITPTHMIVQWSSVGFNVFDDDTYNFFQATITNGADPILPTGNNVSYCYYVMQWAAGDSIGALYQGFVSTPATVGANKGDHIHYAQFGTFDYPGHTYYGPFDTNSQLYWLNDKSFIFNTCVSGNIIPPVIINPNLCDTFTMCAADTSSFTLSFLCPQQGQTATLTAYSPGLSGLTSATVNANSVYSITPKLIAHLRDTGTHVITIKATDNSSPPLSDSMQFTVFIHSCGDTAADLGIEQLNSSSLQTNIYPNPNKGILTLQIKNGELFTRKIHLDIYNTLGQQVYVQYSAISSEIAIILNNAASGVYFYRLSDESGTLIGNGKFVIQE